MVENWLVVIGMATSASALSGRKRVGVRVCVRVARVCSPAWAGKNIHTLSDRTPSFSSNEMLSLEFSEAHDVLLM